VPQQDDFQVLEIVRPKAQGKELKNPPKYDVTEREKHEASRDSEAALLYGSAI
jgi:hypothetical protein